MSLLPVTATMPPPSRLSRFRERYSVLRRLPKFATAVVLLSIFVGIFAPVIAPHSFIDDDLMVRNMPPALTDGGSFDYVLGTDRQGRDVLSRIIGGTRVSLAAASLSVLLGCLIGTLLGIVAGYRGGWVDALIMRGVDVMLAFPTVLLALVMSITVGPSFVGVVCVIGLTLWSPYARLVRSEVLSWKQRDFVAFARITGCSDARIILVHLLPNVLNSVVVLSTLQLGWAIVTEASLSFLGAGIPPPTPTWGGMLADGHDYLQTEWWISVFPGIAMMLVVLSFNMFGNWLRDVLDPRMRQL